MRILLTEDDIEARGVISRSLSRAGYDVEEASDRPSAVKRFRDHPADLVITGLVMRGEDGFELSMDLHRDFPGARVIALSDGNDGLVDSYLAIRCGAETAVPKRDSVTQLLDQVRLSVQA